MSEAARADAQERKDRALVAAHAPVTRKIIQISATYASHELLLHALCDDGTVWQIGDVHNEWGQFPPIPQPGDEP